MWKRWASGVYCRPKRPVALPCYNCLAVVIVESAPGPSMLLLRIQDEQMGTILFLLLLLLFIVQVNVSRKARMETGELSLGRRSSWRQTTSYITLCTP